MPGFLRIVLPWRTSNPWVAPIAFSHGSTAPLLPVGGATILAQWHRLVGNPAGVQSAYAWRGCTYGIHGDHAKAAADFQRAGNDELEVHFRLAHVAALFAQAQTVAGPRCYRTVNQTLDRLNEMAAVRERVTPRNIDACKEIMLWHDLIRWLIHEARFHNSLPHYHLAKNAIADFFPARRAIGPSDIADGDTDESEDDIAAMRPLAIYVWRKIDDDHPAAFQHERALWEYYTATGDRIMSRADLYFHMTLSAAWADELPLVAGDFAEWHRAIRAKETARLEDPEDIARSADMEYLVARSEAQEREREALAYAEAEEMEGPAAGAYEKAAAAWLAMARGPRAAADAAIRDECYSKALRNLDRAALMRMFDIDWNAAGETYVRMIDVEAERGNLFEAANTAQEAAWLFRGFGRMLRAADILIHGGDLLRTCAMNTVADGFPGDAARILRQALAFYAEACALYAPTGDAAGRAWIDGREGLVGGDRSALQRAQGNHEGAGATATAAAQQHLAVARDVTNAAAPTDDRLATLLPDAGDAIRMALHTFGQAARDFAAAATPLQQIAAHFQEGHAAQLVQDFEAADRAFAAVIDLATPLAYATTAETVVDPATRTYALLWLGHAHFKLGQLDDAEQAYARCVRAAVWAHDVQQGAVAQLLRDYVHALRAALDQGRCPRAPEIRPHSARQNRIRMGKYFTQLFDGWESSARPFTTAVDILNRGTRHRDADLPADAHMSQLSTLMAGALYTLGEFYAAGNAYAALGEIAADDLHELLYGPDTVNAPEDTVADAAARFLEADRAAEVRRTLTAAADAFQWAIVAAKLRHDDAAEEAARRGRFSSLLALADHNYDTNKYGDAIALCRRVMQEAKVAGDDLGMTMAEQTEQGFLQLTTQFISLPDTDPPIGWLFSKIFAAAGGDVRAFGLLAFYLETGTSAALYQQLAQGEGAADRLLRRLLGAESESFQRLQRIAEEWQAGQERQPSEAGGPSGAN